ncbi:MAG: glycosyltransferase family 2 protein [Nitrospiraceae bacterium]|jgi:GT2 family glycosyltransferase|nr:MAG: glycosyltransferase family 2 protein [Nitrospiraceae bacterium]
MHKASIIVLNFNGKQIIEECVDSVLNQTYQNVEIIIVDNGSTDGSLEVINEKYQNKVTLIKNEANLGFAEGNNIGISYATGHYISLLNNDAVADPTWLEELVRAAEASDTSYGMWASKILFYENKDVIDTAGHLMYPDGLNRGRGKGEHDDGQYNEKEEVFFPSGCAALYLKQMIDIIGMFDQDFFAYGDDTDLGLKARLAGWKCLYVPTAMVYHKSSVTAGIYSTLKAYLVERNRIWILVKYFPMTAIFQSIFYTLLRYALQAYGAFTGKGAAGRFVEGATRMRLLKVLVKSYSDALVRLPAMMNKRRKLRRIKKVSSNDFIALLRKYRISAKEISLRD